MTQVFRIGDIRPNPFRNIDRYPINRDKVEKLKESIGRTDFWDNLVARIAPDGKPEIGYGHHRMVALREMFTADHEISLIVRDLDDAAMLHVMADENMQEWAASSEVIVETVRAVRDYLAVSHPSKKLGHGAKPNGTDDIVSFLGWPLFRVTEALAIINAEEAGTLKPEDTAGLSIKQAAQLRSHVVHIPDPVIRNRAIGRVREELRDERIGMRGIGDVVREVRAEAAAPSTKPIVPGDVAKAIYADIDNFWRIGIHLNGQGTLTRAEVIRLIAQNRDAIELRGLAKPWSEQIASALLDLARTAEELAGVLRATDAVKVIS
jgi:hypothetical protein